MLWDGLRQPVRMTIAGIDTVRVRDRFSPEGTYLNSATYGLPPRASYDALSRAVDEWRHGRCGFDGWDVSVGESRRSFARLTGVRDDQVAVGPQVSVFAGVIAACLPAGARVLAPREDFTSLLFPFLAQQARGVEVELVALDDLAEAIDGRTDLVAFSAVQSADGRLADTDAIAAAARHHGARVVCDATQACGWLPLDASRFDAVVCAGYKWLLNPRGTAFLTVGDEMLGELTPHLAGWYAADDPMASLYGGPLRVSETAKRFDVSPAWHCWVGAAPALRLLEEVGVEAIHAHDVRLANALRAGLGLEPSNTAIVSLDLDGDAAERLARAGVRCAGRGGRIRFSFHLYNDDGDVARALEVLA